MKVVNLKFHNYPLDNHNILNVLSRDERVRTDEHTFCQNSLAILQKNSLNKIQEFKQYLGFQNVRMLETVLMWYLQHQGCSELQKNQEQMNHLANLYQEELTRKDKKIADLENIHKHLKESLTNSHQQLTKKTAKIAELQSHINSLAKMAKRKALAELNQYGEQLLREFKIGSTAATSPDDMLSKTKVCGLHPKNRVSLPKKFFLTDTRNLNRNSSSDVQLLLRPNKTETSFRFAQTQMTKRQQAKNMRKMQAKRDTTEEIRRLEEEKENCLHNMSQRIILFQKKLATIEEKLEGKKQVLESM